MQPFEVFLSYKRTDESGELTPEVFMAEQLYQMLDAKGIRTFYSGETIGLLGEPKYRSVIDSALEDAYVLVAIGSSVENLTSNWVKYEWESFSDDQLSRKKRGALISYTSGISVHDLPRALRINQNFQREYSTAEEVCNFIVNALKNYKPSDRARSKVYSIATMRELEMRGVSSMQAAQAVMENDRLLYEGLPDAAAGTVEQWAAIFHKFHDFCAFVVDEDNEIYGDYNLIGLTKPQSNQISAGLLRDDSLRADQADNLYLPGVHELYLLNLSVNSFAESAELYEGLWEHLIQMMKTMAERNGVFFSKIYYKAYIPEHEAQAQGHGFHYCCDDRLSGKVFVHDMDPGSTLRSLDKELAELYAGSEKLSAAQKRGRKHTAVDTEALSAYDALWKQINPLFYQGKYRRLKKYFFTSGTGLPENTAEYKLGLSVAEWLRDLLQYASALLPFLPPDRAEAHRQYETQLMRSELIRASMEQYRFSTEQDASLSVQIESETVSVKSIVSFAHIWLDIDRLFMSPDLTDLKPYFYERHDELPDEDSMALCEALALRILTAMKISEDQLRYLPEEFVESYYDYKYMINDAEIVQQVYEKYPFIREELFPGEK